MPVADREDLYSKREMPRSESLSITIEPQNLSVRVEERLATCKSIPRPMGPLIIKKHKQKEAPVEESKVEEIQEIKPSKESKINFHDML